MKKILVILIIIISCSISLQSEAFYRWVTPENSELYGKRLPTIRFDWNPKEGAFYRIKDFSDDIKECILEAVGYKGKFVYIDGWLKEVDEKEDTKGLKTEYLYTSVGEADNFDEHTHIIALNDEYCRYWDENFPLHGEDTWANYLVIPFTESDVCLLLSKYTLTIEYLFPYWGMESSPTRGIGEFSYIFLNKKTRVKNFKSVLPDYKIYLIVTNFKDKKGRDYDAVIAYKEDKGPFEKAIECFLFYDDGSVDLFNKEKNKYTKIK